MLNAILFVRFFIFNAYHLKDLLSIFIIIVTEGSYIVIENLLYIRGCEFFGVIVVLLLDVVLWHWILIYKKKREDLDV